MHQLVELVIKNQISRRIAYEQYILSRQKVTVNLQHKINTNENVNNGHLLISKIRRFSYMTLADVLQESLVNICIHKPVVG